jgi:3-deoxy-D-manno-octulosonic-acid transferase
LIKLTLNCITQIVAQSKIDADRIISLGFAPDKMTISSNLKFDIDLPENLRQQAHSIRESMFPGRPVWIAASTHDGEEKMVFDAHAQILTEYENCMLIIAPRHPQRFEKVAEICKEHGLKYLKKSDGETCHEYTQVFLLDSLGELPLYFACSDIAFIGGSMVPAGGHNMLEPASLALPILSGLHVSNFQYICDLLQEANAIVLVENGNELLSNVKQLLENPGLGKQLGKNAKDIVAAHRGAADQIMSIVSSVLK